MKLLLFCSLSTFSVVHLVAGDRGIWSFSRILLHAYGWKGIKEKEQSIGFIEGSHESVHLLPNYSLSPTKRFLWGFRLVCYQQRRIIPFQSQEWGQTAILAWAHGARMRRQQTSFPGLARLGLLQWPNGQAARVWPKPLGIRDPIPVTPEANDVGPPTTSSNVESGQ